MADPIIRFQGVKKAFGPKQVFEDLTLDVRPGETLTIIGGSGVGKSVALKLLIGLMPVDAGTIQAFGEEVTTMGEARLLHLRGRIAMLFQGAALFDSMTVEENIKYPLIEHKWGTESEMDARVVEVLGMVDMPGVQKLKPAELSGGMRKRVALARAIAMRPEVLFYDGPTEGLDPINVARVNRLLLQLRDELGITTIVVTHQMETVFGAADRVALIDGGKIALQGTPKTLWNSTNATLQPFLRIARSVVHAPRG